MNKIKIILCVLFGVLAVFIFIVLFKNAQTVKINNKEELLKILKLEDVKCNIKSIEVKEVKAESKDDHDGTLIVAVLTTSDKYITANDEEYIETDEVEVYEKIFNKYSFSLKQFDKFGYDFGEAHIKTLIGTEDIQYTVYHGISRTSDGKCEMTVFTTVPQKISVDIESVL